MPKIEVTPDSPRSSISEYATPRSSLGERPVSIGTADPRIPLPKAGAITVQATPAPLAEPSTYKYDKEEMVWRGKRYRLTLDVPLEKPRSSYSEKELEAAAKAFAKELLSDLKGRLDMQAGCPIQAGENFKVLFDNEGYVAFTPNSDASVTAHDEPAKELSQIIEQKNPQKILQSLKARMAKRPPPSFTPIGLVNLGVQCFANTAFQQWVSNPLLRKELFEHPEYLIGGKENSLFRAFEEYTSSSSPYDLKELLQKLNINTQTQDDTDVVVNALRDQLDFKKIPQTSPLYSQIERSFLLEGGNWVPQAHKEPPAMGYRYLHPTPNQTLAQLLTEQSLSEGDGVQMREHENKKREREKEVFSHPPGILNLYVRRNKTSAEKDRTPIRIDSLQIRLPKEVCKEETDYELMSYGLHLGETPRSGHWVAYIREGKKFFRASDEQVQEVSQAEFLEHAPLASSFFLNRKDS